MCALFEPLILEGFDCEMDLLMKGLIDPMRVITGVDLL